MTNHLTSKDLCELIALVRTEHYHHEVGTNESAYWEGLIDRLYEELNQHGIYSTAEEPVSDNELEGVTFDDT